MWHMIREEKPSFANTSKICLYEASWLSCKSPAGDWGVGDEKGVAHLLETNCRKSLLQNWICHLYDVWTFRGRGRCLLKISTNATLNEFYNRKATAIQLFRSAWSQSTHVISLRQHPQLLCLYWVNGLEQKRSYQLHACSATVAVKQLQWLCKVYKRRQYENNRGRAAKQPLTLAFCCKTQLWP